MAKIGVFDSGYGGLTILEKMRQKLPQYDYIYLGDNARTPYGTRSFEVIYEYTWQCVRRLFDEGCELVILACNTASAKALRSIQQRQLIDVWKAENSQRKRVLGVIRPTVESVLDHAATLEPLNTDSTQPQLNVNPTSTQTPRETSVRLPRDFRESSARVPREFRETSNSSVRHIGVLATPGTITSESYVLELQKIDANAIVTQQPCPMWVPLIEANEHLTPGADFFVQKYVWSLLEKDPAIDTIILGCTHYPLLYDKIRAQVPSHIRLVAQGELVAESLADYLVRHNDLQACLSQNGTCHFLTTESAEKFSQSASIFLSAPVQPEHIELTN